MLGRHHVIGAAIGLAGDDGYLRHRRLAIGEQQLCAMLDDAVMLLRSARKETGHIDAGHDRDFAGVAETPEAGRRFPTYDDEPALPPHRRSEHRRSANASHCPLAYRG